VTAVSIEGVWKEYGAKVVLENVNLEVAPRSFCVLAGPSGCGKSTLLRLLLGQEAATKGRIRVGGEPLPPEPGPDRGVVFQRYSVFPHLTVLGNVVLGLELERSKLLGKLFGAARRRAAAEAMQYLEAVGLARERDTYPHALSGGMRQRLSLAQALIRQPRILLLDEPFAALDPGTKDSIHELVLELWEESGMTIFLVTHDLREGFKLGTRLLILERLRVDPQAPERFGATITYDLKVERKRTAAARRELEQRLAGDFAQPRKPPVAALLPAERARELG
jgi:NitT/TauT family transport system ATP-binding protein